MDEHQARRTILVLLLCSNLQHGLTELEVCSDYLVSGLNGVQLTAISATSSHASTHDTKYSRLYTSDSSKGWVSNTVDTNQYIQVQLHQMASVNAIILQGRGSTVVAQWVKTYIVSYSNDSVTWSDVTAPNGLSQVFTGNSDRNTVVKADIIPSVTGMYIRIKPQTWNDRISLRFDVSGCYLVDEGSTKETFARIPVITSSDYMEGLVFDVSTTSISKCTAMCKATPTCLSFTYGKGQDSCRGFALAAPGLYGQFSSLGNASQCFRRTGKAESLRFRKFQGGNRYYKVVELTRNQLSAKDMCAQFSSQLIPLETASEVTALQNVITGNDILRRNFRFYVSGEYVSNQWQYTGVPKVINSNLWSTNQPNPSQGHCVMLTETGLASVDCSEILFFICVV